VIFSARCAAAADHVMHAPGPRYNAPMTDDELRLIVREAVARHLGRPATGPPVARVLPSIASPGVLPLPEPPWRAHPSHLRVALPIGRDEDGPCLVEPSVGCTHCAFCQSYGH